MLVSELVQWADREHVDYVEAPLGSITADKGTLKTPFRDVALDDSAYRHLCKYLNIPSGKFVSELPYNIQDELINYFLFRHPDDDAMFMLRGRQMVGMGAAGKPVLTAHDYVNMLGRAGVPASAEVANLWEDDLYNKICIDVRIDSPEHQVEVREGDIVSSGLRVQGMVGPLTKAPVVSSYLERLMCTNGMTHTHPMHKISLTGNTVDEVLAEMDAVASLVLGDFNQSQRDKILVSADVPVNNPEQMAFQLMRDARITDRVQSAVMGILPERDGDSWWDLVNIITSAQHFDGLNLAQRDALQSLGGSMIHNQSHRCPTCAHTLKSEV